MIFMHTGQNKLKFFKTCMVLWSLWCSSVLFCSGCSTSDAKSKKSNNVVEKAIKLKQELKETILLSLDQDIHKVSLDQLFTRIDTLYVKLEELLSQNVSKQVLVDDNKLFNEEKRNLEQKKVQKVSDKLQALEKKLELGIPEEDKQTILPIYVDTLEEFLKVLTKVASLDLNTIESLLNLFKLANRSTEKKNNQEDGKDLNCIIHMLEMIQKVEASVQKLLENILTLLQEAKAVDLNTTVQVLDTLFRLADQGFDEYLTAMD